MAVNFSDLCRYAEPGVIVVGIDPGETTGLCAFSGDELVAVDQIPTRTASKGALAILRWIEDVLERTGASEVTIALEAYRIYAHKLKTHSGSSVHTLRLIGALEYVTDRAGWRCVQKMAGDVKGFFTDQKLRRWGFLQRRKRHANDAIRHACHFLAFGDKRVRKTT